ncbi:undecaprenyldiphospho-muramoylpentapeptide beta-N-acetylglucosaminyltransferase [Nitrospira sp. NS4]|uniref:undecaprenyldiphospho-muramoylpentapeptide beta-N-acetylglucosaminyltransferase n=1 Tax=Nitrospira sp. NS4 TaxID=3414498 RepID=UPI003C2CF4B9
MTIVIAAGGTGGHLYPAVALAREFLRRDPSAKIVFVGTTKGIESKVLAHERFPLELITAKPVMGKGLGEALRGLLSVPIGIWQSWRILGAHKADLVIGVGGYTSPTMLAAAALRGIARVILEPNAYPGMANIAVGPLAQRVFLAFDSAADKFAKSKVRVVGTPIRQDFLRDTTRPEPSATGDPQRLLIFGGSQGAKAINSAVIDSLAPLMQKLPKLSITHQTGEADHARVAEAYRQAGVQAEVVPFLYDMPRVLRGADLVVARSGAMTIAELTACGKPAILIPLPTAIYNHQMMNARAMEAAGGAVVLPQPELTGAQLARTIADILQQPDRLRRMQDKSRGMRRIEAAETIVRECYALMGVNHDHNRTVGAAGA